MFYKGADNPHLLVDLRTALLIEQHDRADLRVEMLSLRAEWTAAERTSVLEAALSLCARAGAGDDRLRRLGRETHARVQALCPAPHPLPGRR